MNADTAKGLSSQPQVHLPSTNSLQLIHRLLDNLISRHEEQAPSVRVHLSQVLLFFWCPNELKDERRLFYLDILHELQVACLSYGAEVIIVDPFEWYGSSVAIQPDMLSLFLQELCHCKRFSSGPFFVAITCEQCNTFVLPSVLAEEVVSQLTTHFSEQKRPFPFSDLYQTVQDSKGRRYFELKRFDTLGQKGLDAYALLCMRLETCRQTEQDEPWLSKIFPYLYELLISRASEGEAQFNNRSLVVWKRDIAVTKLNLHQGDDSSHDRASCLGSQRSSGLSTCDVEILMAPLVHVQTFSDPSSTTFIKQGSLDSYLRKFYYRVSTKLKCKIQAGLDVGRSESDEDQLLLSFKEDGIVHCQYALCHQKDILLGQDSLVSQVKAAFEKINAGQRSIAILKGSHGQGKTALLCHIADEVSSWMDIGYVVLRFARLTPLSSTIHELLLGCCLELCGQFQLKTILPDRVSRYSIQQIFDWLKECCDQVAYKTCGKPVLLLVDDIHRLKESSSISDSKLPFWLPTRLPPNMLFLATLNEEVHLEQRFYTDVVTRDCIFAIPPLLADNCRLLYERYIDRGGDGVQLLSNDSRLDGMGACPLAIRMLAEMPETVEWISSEQANEPANVLTKLAALVDARFRMAERRCGSLICRFALSYIECAHFGLTLGELLDLLTCCEPAMHEVLSKAGKDQEVHQFPLAIWLKLKQCLGCLLEEVVCDGRTVYKWAHRFVVGVVRRRYLCTVQELKDCHMSLATLLNSTLSPIGIMDSAALNVKLRPVMPRPLVYASNDGTPVFNLRVIRSLWYHLLHTGSVECLQSQSLCNFEYLYASIRSAGIFHLKSMFESAMLQLLSHNFHVLSSSILRPSADILCQDGNLLAAEVILALHYTRSDNSDVLNSLLEQAMSWVDSSSGIPLLVPLASWVKPKTCPLVVSCRFQEPWSVDGTAGALVLEPTLNHQHVLVSGGGHGFAIWMYHISSRKQVRSFEGHQSSVVFLKTIADGQLFLSCACDGMVMIWSWTQVNCHRSFRPGKGKLLSACVAHSNEFLLTGFADCQVVLTPLFSEGNELANEARTFAHHTGPVTALALTSQDMYLLSGSADFTVVISCMRTGLPISTLSGLMAPVKTLAVTSNDAFAVLSCEDESLKVFSICMSSQLLEIIGHEEKICSLAIATDDCRVFAGSSDGKVYCFDLHTGELVSTQTCHQKAVSCLKLSADGLLLMSGSVDGFNVWSTYTNDADNGNEANYVCVATISPDYKYAAYGNNSGRVILWDLENCHDIWMTPSANDPLVTSLQFDHDSVILLSGSADGLVRILSMANGLTLKTYEGHSHPVTCLRIFTDRSVVISLDSLGHVILWSTEDTEDCSYEAFGLSDVGSLLEFLDDSDVLVTVKDNEKELKVLNMVGREEAWVTKARLQHNDDITCLCVSANGQVLVTGSKDMSLKLWSIKSASLTQVMAEHQQPVKHCAVNVDGSMVVSASTSEALSWNVCSGQSLCSFEAHKAPITSLVVSEDGKIALSSDENGWLYAWHTVDGDRIACFNAHLPVVSILISPDCRRIVLTLERCPHIACLCLHNIPFYEDIVSDSFSAQTFGVPSSIISGRAVIDSNINDIANVPNTNSIQTVKVQPLSSVNNASRDAPARRSRPGTASSNFKRSRSSLRLFDKLKRNQTQFFNVSPSVRSSYRGELIPTAMLASQSVCGAVTMSHSSGSEKATIKPPRQNKTRICCLL